MHTVKTRKVGNSLAITFQKELNIEEGKSSSFTKGWMISLFLHLKFLIHLTTLNPSSWKITLKE